MKKLLFTFSLLAAFLISGELSAKKVKFSGKIYHGEEIVKGVSLEVYFNDDLVLTHQASENGKFKFYLEDGKIYKIVVKKEGFVDKVLNLSLEKRYDDEVVPPFAFDLALYKVKEFKYLNTAVETSPAAYIYYNEQLGILDWDRNVTAQAKKEIAELKELNKEKRQQKYQNF